MLSHNEDNNDKFMGENNWIPLKVSCSPGHLKRFNDLTLKLTRGVIDPRKCFNR